MRGKLSLFAGLLLTGAAAAALPAAAQSLPEVEAACWDEWQEFEPEEQVAACSAMLEWDGLDAEDRPYVIAMRGWSYHEMGRLEQALADYSEKIRLQPGVADGYGWRGSVYLDQADYPNALADYSRAIGLGPEIEDLGVLYHDRGYARQMLGDYEAAIYDFSRAVEFAPYEPDYWNSRCWARAVWNRQVAEALDDCDAALTIDPQSFHAYDSRGLVRLRREEWDAALADYADSLGIEPTASAYFGSGVALERMGLSDDAEQSFAAAAELDPTIAETYAGYGIVR